MPIRDGKDALRVNGLEIEIVNKVGKVTYRNSVADLAVDQSNVAEIAAFARAGWKIENETLNVLKNNGYHLEHNFGHGKQNPSALIASACHGLHEIFDVRWQKTHDALGARQRFFEDLRTITTYLVFPILVRTRANPQSPDNSLRSEPAPERKPKPTTAPDRTGTRPIIRIAEYDASSSTIARMMCYSQLNVEACPGGSSFEMS